MEQIATVITDVPGPVFTATEQQPRQKGDITNYLLNSV
jgi:hypothetical protein